MNEPRHTQPGSNNPLRISDLIEILSELKREYGDLWCYIYSTDKRASVPMLALNLDVKRTTVSFSAQVGAISDEMMLDLLEEIRLLREYHQRTGEIFRSAELAKSSPYTTCKMLYGLYDRIRRRLTPVPADRLQSPRREALDDTAAAEHHR